MGWTATTDPTGNLTLSFPDDNAAIAFAQRNGTRILQLLLLPFLNNLLRLPSLELADYRSIGAGKELCKILKKLTALPFASLPFLTAPIHATGSMPLSSLTSSGFEYEISTPEGQERIREPKDYAYNFRFRDPKKEHNSNFDF